MKRLLPMALAGILALAACQQTQQEAEQPAPAEQAAPSEQAAAGETHEMAAPEGEQALLHKEDPKGTYGAGIVLKQATTLETILAEPSEYEGKIVQVAGTKGGAEFDPLVGEFGLEERRLAGFARLSPDDHQERRGLESARHLMQHPGRVFTREQLLDSVRRLRSEPGA